VKVLLDTSAYSGLMKGDAELRDLLSAAGQVLVPSVVLGELRSGFRRGSREAVNLRQLEQFLAKPLVRVVDVSSDTAAWYAEVDFYLFSKGRPIPRNDVWIAALAMEHGAILLTRDAHFRELPLLPIRP
jgi:tRNA(fMet)-specific endonuclease VapC